MTRGHLIQYNRFYRIGDTNKDAMGTHPVYLDDCASGVTIRSNCFEGGYRTVLIGGGRDNIVEGNLFVDCNFAVSFDARGISKGSNQETLHRRLRSVPYDKPPWSTRYPSLATILENSPSAPVGNRVEHNVIAGGKPFMFRTKDPALKALFTIRDNWIGDDPGFVDRGARDFRLHGDSPARACGYQDIPFDQIGPRKPQ